MSVISASSEQKKINMKTELTLQEAIARESPEMQEKIHKEAKRLRAEYANRTESQ